MGNIIEAFVAFDTSKLRNAVAIAEAGRAGEVRLLGEIENTEAAIAKLVRKLAAKHGRLTFCYEAGPTGYGLYRQIKSLGHECLVVVPSLILKKPGERVKTNRRDAVGLVKQLRGGDLTAVWVPDPRHEAMRERGKWRWRICDASASRYRRFCCGKACIIRAGGRGPSRTGTGSPARSSHTRSSASPSRRCCWRCARRRSASSGWSRRSAWRSPIGRWPKL